MKLVYLLVIISMLFFVGCAKQTYICPDGTEVDVVEHCPQQEPEPESENVPDETLPEPVPEPVKETEPETTEPEIDIEGQVQELIDKAAEKVKSFSYIYVGPPENLPRDEFHVKGDKMRISLMQDTDFKISQDYTHVYLDSTTNKAEGWCAARDNFRCPDGIVDHGSVKYTDHYVKSPLDWLNNFKTAKSLGSGPQWSKRSTTIVKFTTLDGESGEMYVVDFYALPIKVMLDNGDKIEFRDLAVNTVTEAEVMPPKI